MVVGGVLGYVGDGVSGGEWWLQGKGLVDGVKGMWVVVMGSW